MDNLVVQARKKIQALLMGTNNIDKLMSEKVDAYCLIEEQPASFQIGKYTIFVGNLTIENNYKFWDMYGKVLAHVGLKHVNFDLLADGGELYKSLLLHRRMYKELCALLHKTICKQQAYYLDQITKERKLLKWHNIPWRYLVKNISIEKLIQMLFMVYLYNFDAEKKNLQVLAFVLPRDGTATMERYMSFWFQNMAGLTGKFVEPLLIKPLPCSEDETNGLEGEDLMEALGEKRKEKGLDSVDSGQPTAN